MKLSIRSPQSLSALVKAFELLRDLRPKMPIQTAFIFLLIARQPGILAREIEELTGLSQASVSRNVAALCKFDRHGELGLGLIKRTLDVRETRAHRLKLTTKGKTLALALASTLG